MCKILELNLKTIKVRILIILNIDWIRRINNLKICSSQTIEAKNWMSQATAEYKKFKCPDDKEFEVSYFGPTGNGVQGELSLYVYYWSFWHHGFHRKVLILRLRCLLFPWKRDQVNRSTNNNAYYILTINYEKKTSSSNVIKKLFW